MKGFVVLVSLLLSACAFDTAGQEMAEPDGGAIVDDLDAGTPSTIDAAPTPDPTPAPPDARPDDDEDDHSGPGGGQGGGGHGGGGN